MVKQLLSLVAVATTACGGVENMEVDNDDLTTPLAQRCELLEGRRFVTVDQQTDCGPAPAGSQFHCRWYVTFAASTDSASSFTYRYSDVGLSGTATCNGASVIEIQLDGLPGLTGSYDPNTDTLDWDGLAFEAAP